MNGGINWNKDMNTTTTEAAKAPDTVYRVSIHNQIYSSTYYVVTKWEIGKKGGYRSTGNFRRGMRGKGNALGLSYGEAAEIAAKLNREEGWSKGMQVLNSKGKVQFSLHA